MHEVTKINNVSFNLIDMGDMLPLQVGIINYTLSARHNDVVMRTCAIDHFEVINLSTPSEFNYWDKPNKVKVRLLTKGEKVTVNFFNEK